MEPDERQWQQQDEERRMQSILSVLISAREHALSDAELLDLAIEAGVSSEWRQLINTMQEAA